MPQTGYAIDAGQNYIIGAQNNILANSSSSFVYDLTGVSGRVRLTAILFSTNQVPSNADFDLRVLRFLVERFDATRAENMIIDADGGIPLKELAGFDAGLPGLLSAVEVLLARSRITIDVENTTSKAINTSITLVGHTYYNPPPNQPGDLSDVGPEGYESHPSSIYRGGRSIPRSRAEHESF